MDDQQLLEVLRTASTAVRASLEEFDDRGPSGAREGQYQLDLVADAAAVDVLVRAGLSVLSEESGISGETGGLFAILDPVDGSTNASRGIPWYATSICVLDDNGPWVALVDDHAHRIRYEAIRGAGATRDGRSIAPSPCRHLEEAIISVTGYPTAAPGWAQFRTLGAAALELCAVADGTLDGFAALGGFGLHVWDYAGAMLVCEEAGAVLSEQDGQELVIRDDRKRRVLAASTQELLKAVKEAVAS